MGVSYLNPAALIIGGFLCAAVCVSAFLMKKKPDSRNSLRVANTNRIKATPLYKRVLIEAMVFRIVSFVGLILALVAALFLTARPVRRETVKTEITRKDIFLCIDLSASNYAGVQELIEAFSNTVSELDGDRVGICVFNTSSLQYVPMTDDYEFVLRRLDSLAGYLAAEEEFSVNFVQKYDSVYDIPESERGRYEELNRTLSSFDEGITAGYEMKGTSAIGEGLASCLFCFPELYEEERTRIILFMTDNHEELLDAPLVTLADAAEMCALDDVAVFGIYTGNQSGTDSAAEIEEMRDAVEQTAGNFYQSGVSGGTLTAEEILSDIKSRETEMTSTAIASVNIDEPTVWFIVFAVGVFLLAASTIYFILRRGAGRGDRSRKRTAAILLLALVLCAAAIAIKPKYHSPTTEITTNNLDVVIAVDTTISMWAEDHDGGTRMDGVKKDINRIIERLPGSSISLIRFDNGAEILTPFTQDIQTVTDMVEHFSMPAFATAKGSSPNTVYEALKDVLNSSSDRGKDRRTIVFLFSDGETTDGSSLRSFSDLSGLINDGAVLGYGTEAGGRMFYPGRGYLQNSTQGTDAKSVIDAAALKQIAKDLDIDYVNRTDGSERAFEAKLESVRLMSRDAAVSDENAPSDRETYFYFSALAAAILLVWLFLTLNRGGVA